MTRNRTRGGMNEQASAWLSALEGLPEAHERLKRVVIFNDDACEVILREDDKETFFYCDPPYVHSTRKGGSYEHEMTDSQHYDLLSTLADIKGRKSNPRKSSAFGRTTPPLVLVGLLYRDCGSVCSIFSSAGMLCCNKKPSPSVIPSATSADLLSHLD